MTYLKTMSRIYALKRPLHLPFIKFPKIFLKKLTFNVSATASQKNNNNKKMNNKAKYCQKQKKTLIPFRYMNPINNST